MKTSKTLLTLFVVWSSTCAQVSIPSDKDQLLSGEAAGEVFIAEKNDYVSPQRILELKDELGLTKGQINKIDEMLRNLPVSATVKGQEIVEAEEELNTLFASGTMNDKTLRTKLENIGLLRAALRFTHLQVYLKAKQILSSNQWYRLKELQAREGK